MISAEREWSHLKTLTNRIHWIRFVFGKIPVGKMALLQCDFTTAYKSRSTALFVPVCCCKDD